MSISRGRKRPIEYEIQGKKAKVIEPDYISVLPPEIKLMILEYLPPRSLVNFCNSSRYACPAYLILERRWAEYGDRTRYGDPLRDYTRLVKGCGTPMIFNYNPGTGAYYLLNFKLPDFLHYPVKFPGNPPQGKSMVFIGITDLEVSGYGTTVQVGKLFEHANNTTALGEATDYLNQEYFREVGDLVSQEYRLTKITDNLGKPIPVPSAYIPDTDFSRGLQLQFEYPGDLEYAPSNAHLHFELFTLIYS